MGLTTADDYRASLRDGRTLWYRGRRVHDILEEPDLRVAVDHAALDYEIGHDPLYRDLAVAKDPDTGCEHSAYYAIPHSADDLLARSRLIETVTGLGGTMVTLVKEIGSDALFGLLRVLEGEARERAVTYYEHCRDLDLSVAVAQTDVHRMFGSMPRSTTTSRSPNVTTKQSLAGQVNARVTPLTSSTCGRWDW